MGKLSKLTALSVQRLNKRGRYADGGGLYLQISVSGSKSWLFRYMKDRKAREMGLGSLNAVTLAQAREKAFEFRRMLAEGQDPLESKAEMKRARALESAKSVTFKECAEAFLQSHSQKWSNPKHREQWETTLESYVYPKIGDISVGQVDMTLVLKVLEPIWHSKTETASRIRGRIENILNYAKVREWRSGENPARWRGHLDQILPRRNDIAAVEHFAALPIADVPQFMTALRAQDGIAPWALEFAILTAARTSEAVNAEWSEFDLEQGIWVVPAERMKHGKEHRVPLSKRAIEILQNLKRIRISKYVFPGRKNGHPLSNMSLLQLLKVRMGLKITAHGFRSTFRDWASERTNFQNEVIEMALAHTIGNKVEAAYRRGDLFLKRLKLMNAWSEFCLSPVQSASVIELGIDKIS